MKQISNMYLELEECTWRKHVFTNVKRRKKKTAVSARSAGTTFKNLHQQKFAGEFRISGGILTWKKHCSAGPHHPYPRTILYCVLY